MSVMLLAGSMPLAALAEVDISAPVLAADWQTVQNAVSNSSDDIVKIRVTEDIIVLSDNAHNIGKTIEIDLDGHTIDGCIHQVFWNEKGTMTIKNGTIKNAVSNIGGAINNRGTMHLEDVVITDCIANQGGGILNYGTLTMTGGAIKNCKAGRGGGINISSAFGTAEISGTTIENNKSTTNGGGGISNKASLILKGTVTVMGNSASDNSGGIYHNGKALNIQGKITVKENKPDNLYLYNGKKIKVTGTLDNNSHIGVIILQKQQRKMQPAQKPAILNTIPAADVENSSVMQKERRRSARRIRAFLRKTTPL